MSELLTQAAALVELPEKAMPDFGIVVVSYMDEEGEAKFGLQTLGDPTFSAIAGLMAMASHHLFHLANPTPCEVNEDEE